jgi:hypothetical protein
LLDRSIESIPRSIEHVPSDHGSSVSCWVCPVQTGISMLVSSCGKVRFEIGDVPLQIFPWRMSIGRFVLRNRSTNVVKHTKRAAKRQRSLLVVHSVSVVRIEVVGDDPRNHIS